MRLLIISDIHGRVDQVNALLGKLDEVGLVLVAGDITNFGGYEQAEAVMDPILARSIPVLAVAGNCDPEGVQDYLSDRQVALQDKPTRHGELAIVGADGSLPCPSTTPGEYGDNYFETTLSKAVLQLRDGQPAGGVANLVVVTHQPAFETYVDTVNGRSTGSQAIRRFIEIHKPILAVSGHIHEAFGTDVLGPTTLVNPGPLKQGRYAIVDIQNGQVQVRLCVLG